MVDGHGAGKGDRYRKVDREKWNKAWKPLEKEKEDKEKRMNIFDFYLPVDGYILKECNRGKIAIKVQPYEFENFLHNTINPFLDQHNLPMFFWNEVQHGNRQRYYHLQIIVDGTTDPDVLLGLISMVQVYIVNFQTGPIMWNNQENCGVLNAQTL